MDILQRQQARKARSVVSKARSSGSWLESEDRASIDGALQLRSEDYAARTVFSHSPALPALPTGLPLTFTEAVAKSEAFPVDVEAQHSPAPFRSWALWSPPAPKSERIRRQKSSGWPITDPSQSQSEQWPSSDAKSTRWPWSSGLDATSLPKETEEQSRIAPSVIKRGTDKLGRKSLIVLLALSVIGLGALVCFIALIIMRANEHQ